jgi:hypothetical protein
MTSDDLGSSAPLSEMERARLRPSVDVAALERWLIATNDDIRFAVIVHFSTHISAEDLRAVGEAIGASAEDLAAWEEPPPEELSDLGPLCTPGPDAPPNAVTYRSGFGGWQPVVMIMPPEDPDRFALWSAIETTP